MRQYRSDAGGPSCTRLLRVSTEGLLTVADTSLETYLFRGWRARGASKQGR